MKKLLALVLAFVMTLGLATVGANAALSDTFKDADAIQNKEAVAVMNAIGILIGDDNGNFRGGDNLTRGEAAKIISYLLLGNKTAEDLGAMGTKFSDVPASHWACKYIEFCASKGIINGYGDGKFGPNDTLKTIDFAKMLLGALGYDAVKEGMTGDDYRIATSSLANREGVFSGNKNVTAMSDITRDEAALYAFNVIKTPLVEYKDKGGSITINGAELSLGGSGATYVVSTLASEQSISRARLTNTGVTSDGGFSVEFGERYYPELRLIDDNDDFMRPANTWTYKNKLIGTYVNYDLQYGDEYTTAVSGKTLFEHIGSETLRLCDVNYFVDGRDATGVPAYNVATTITKNNTDTWGETGNGVLTQLFKIGDEIRIVSVNTYIAFVDREYNKSKGAAGFDVANVDDFDGVGLDAGWVNADDISLVKDMALDDAALVKVAWNGTNYSIVEVNPTVKSNEDVTVTKWSRGSGYLVTGGQQQDWSEKIDEEFTAEYIAEALNHNYDLYYDTYGYVIGAYEVQAAAKYVFMSAFDLATSNLAVKTADAFLIFLDGTTATAQVNVSKTDENIRKAQIATGDNFYTELSKFSLGTGGSEHYNKWFKYSVSGEGANAVYTLNPVVKDGEYLTFSDQLIAGTKVSTRNPNLTDTYNATGKVYGNDSSVFMTVGNSANSSAYLGSHKAISKVSGGPYTGVQSVSLKASNTPSWDADVNADYDNKDDNVFVVYNGDRYIIGCLIFGTDSGAAKYYTYAVKAVSSERKEGGYYYWEFQGIVDGQLKTLTVKDDEANDVIATIAQQLTVDDATDETNAAPYNFEGDGIGYRTMFSLTYDKDGFITGAEIVYNDMADAWYTEAKYAAGLAYDEEAVYDVAWTMTSAPTDLGNGLSADTAADLEATLGGVFATAQNDKIEDNSWNLTAKGNTLYIGDGLGSDIGLTVASGAPIWVVQYYEVGGVKAEQYSTFKAAVASLRYGNSNSTADSFNGIISAALNANGTAKWVVLKSNDPIPAVNSTTPTPTTGVIRKVVINSDGIIYINGYDTAVTDKSSFEDGEFEVEIYKRTPAQDDYKRVGQFTWEAASGNEMESGLTIGNLLKNTKSDAAALTADDAYYVVIDGVKSNEATIA